MTDNLIKRAKELQELQRFPTATRSQTAAAKVLMNLLIGGGTIVTLIILETEIHIILLIGMLVGAIAYGAKAARDVYKRWKEEKELTLQLQENLKKLGDLFDEEVKVGSANQKALFKTLQTSLKLLDENKLSRNQIEELNTHLVDLKKVFSIAFPDTKIKTQYTDFINDSVKRVRDKKSELQPSVYSHHDFNIIHFVESVPKKKEFWLSRYTKKTGNRLLSFIGGASAAAAVGVGIAGFVFGISNPVGWALVGIIAGAILIGGLSVVLDYYASRRQDEKIEKLKEKNRELTLLRRGVVQVTNKLNQINNCAKRFNQVKEEYEVDRNKILCERNSALEKAHQFETEYMSAQKKVQQLEQEKLALERQGFFNKSNQEVVISAPAIAKETQQSSIWNWFGRR